MQQAQDFLDESRALFALVDSAGPDCLATVTQFKQWAIADVVRHLHFWNRAVLMALQAPDEFKGFIGGVLQHMTSGAPLRDHEAEVLAGLDGQALIDAWRDTFEQTAAAFASADPSTRVPWAGPSMSARSSISARQMETWAHGQEVFDALGAGREEHDRIRNIVVLGVNTFGWTFQTRKQPPPEPTPEVLLVSPSGEQWQYGVPQPENRVSGSAVEFAQVVTQTRNIADTALEVVGEPARLWMANAQCFAGNATPPPAPGTRFRAQT